MTFHWRKIPLGNFYKQCHSQECLWKQENNAINYMRAQVVKKKKKIYILSKIVITSDFRISNLRKKHILGKKKTLDVLKTNNF